MKFKKIINGSIILALSSLLSRLLGIVREAVFANTFGAEAQNAAMDINTYFAAFKIPDLIYTLLIFGAVSAAFLPIYTKLKNKDEGKASHFSNQIINGVLLISTSFSALAFVLAPWIVPILVPGFEQEAIQTTSNLTRIMLISPTLFGLSSILQGLENSHKRYWGIALAPIVYNLSIIFATILFANKMGVYGLAWGVAIGALLHFLVQLPGAIKCGYRYRFTKNLIDKNSIQFIRLSIPRILGLSLTQIGTLVDTFIASLLTAGSIAIFTYAGNLQSLAYGVVGISVSIAAFAHLAEEAQEKDKTAFIQTLRASSENILFWIVPAIAGLFILNQEIVTWILERGAFSKEASAMTALTLSIFIWAALGQSLIPLYARAFYALEDTKTPVSIALLAVSINITISLILTQIYNFEVWALAISAVISSTINAGLLLVFLKRKISSNESLFPRKAFFRNIIFAGLMLATVVSLKRLNINNLTLEIFTLIAAGGAVYLGLHKIKKTILT